MATPRAHSGTISLARKLSQCGKEGTGVRAGHGWGALLSCLVASPPSVGVVPFCPSAPRGCGCGITGHHTALLAWSGSSRWPSILESSVQSGRFRVGGACFTLAGALGVCKALALGQQEPRKPSRPCASRLGWAGACQAGSGRLSLPSTQETGFSCLKWCHWALVPIWSSSHGQCID